MAITSRLLGTAPEEALLQQWEPLVRRLAKGFAGAAEREDLEQIARLALWQAACRFDPGRGYHFATFAIPTIVGSLKRYVRDQALAGGIPRRWWELRPRLMRAAEGLTQTLGRRPAVHELAAHLAVSEEDVAGALGARDLGYPQPLDERVDDGEENGASPLAEQVGTLDPLLEVTETRLVVRDALEALAEPAQELLRQRYFQGRTQQEVARALGISQMHVSRLERQALAGLRQALHGAWEIAQEPVGETTGAPPAPSDGGGRSARGAALGPDTDGS